LRSWWFIVQTRKPLPAPALDKSTARQRFARRAHEAQVGFKVVYSHDLKGLLQAVKVPVPGKQTALGDD